MKKEPGLTSGTSEPESVNEFMRSLKHPLADITQYLRSVILSVDKNIGEGIYWNAPTFYFTGKVEPFNPKEYKRYIAGFVFNKKDVIRMVFLKGAAVKDKTGLLEGDYTDGRRLAVFTSMEDAKKKEKALKAIIKELVMGIKVPK